MTHEQFEGANPLDAPSSRPGARPMTEYRVVCEEMELALVSGPEPGAWREAVRQLTIFSKGTSVKLQKKKQSRWVDIFFYNTGADQ